MAAGKTRAEIALEAGVSDYTVKIQLAAIFDKTGTGDQRQLQMLVRDLTPPVGPPDQVEAGTAPARGLRMFPIWLGLMAQVDYLDAMSFAAVAGF